MINAKFTPIEMPVGSKYGNDYFVVNSYKLGRVVKLYSKLEFKNWLTLELNPEVLTFCEQPFRAEMLINGKVKETVFDMWVSYKNGCEEFQEVKYSDELTNPQNNSYTRCTEQIDFQRKWCKFNKMPYTVRNEDDIEHGRYHIENLKHISSCIKRYDHNYAKSYYERICIALNQESITLENLYYNMAHQLYFNEFLSVISFAYYDGLISLELINNPLGMNTEVKQFGKQAMQFS